MENMLQQNAYNSLYEIFSSACYCMDLDLNEFCSELLNYINDEKELTHISNYYDFLQNENHYKNNFDIRDLIHTEIEAIFKYETMDSKKELIRIFNENIKVEMIRTLDKYYYNV